MIDWVQHLFRLAEEFSDDKSRPDFETFSDSFFVRILLRFLKLGCNFYLGVKMKVFCLFFLAKNQSKSYNLLNFQAGFNEELWTKLEIDSASERRVMRVRCQNDDPLQRKSRLRIYAQMPWMTMHS